MEGGGLVQSGLIKTIIFVVIILLIIAALLYALGIAGFVTGKGYRFLIFV